ncbi:MAG TPA: cytochrome P460 family protein [Acidobacteriota bacterium]|nr:cytochrome P460 family protein [Acidobacteriota bacterium]
MNRMVLLAFILTLGAGAVLSGLQVEPFSPWADAQGNIRLPEEFRTTWSHLGDWVVPEEGGLSFHEVYASPETVDYYKRHRQFPDGAVLVKEVRSSSSAQMTTGRASWASDNQIWFVMIKDAHNRFPDNPLWGDGWGWALFAAEDPQVNVTKDYRQECLPCHLPAKEHDWVYVEGYPTLKPAPAAAGMNASHAGGMGSGAMSTSHAGSAGGTGAMSVPQEGEANESDMSASHAGDHGAGPPSVSQEREAGAPDMSVGQPGPAEAAGSISASQEGNSDAPGPRNRLPSNAGPRKESAASDDVPENSVRMNMLAYSPQTLTVKVGTTVTWINEDPFPHTATADDGSFDTGTIASKQRASVTFNDPGTFPYTCTPHPFMKGTIKVVE